VTRIWAGVDRILRISPEGSRDRANPVAWRVRTSVAMSAALHAILVVAVVRTWPDATSGRLDRQRAGGARERGRAEFAGDLLPSTRPSRSTRARIINDARGVARPAGLEIF